ncbi:MAG TPA: hypothetical protein VFX29_07165, partial [Longimicrobiaceae bacterium]|nr:hypothetical protein [Longimicrobiaceae bacterium]
MDPLALLLVVVFFVLPLLQQMAEKRRKRGPRLPPLELPDEEASHREAPRVRIERGEGGWSVDWGAWPTEAPRAAEDEDDRAAERDAAASYEVSREDPRGASYETLPAPLVRDRAPLAISLESVEI